MLHRKEQKNIINWINNGKNALLIEGARQVGKTYLIRETLKEMNCDFIEINFIREKYILDVLKSLDKGIDNFLNQLTLLTNHKFIKGKTVIFFDEIQEYKEILTSIKFLVEDGSFKYILSGSLLGVELTNIKSAPIDFLNTIKMYPLTFKEFIINLGVSNQTIDYLKSCYINETEVDEVIHNKIMEIFKTYLIVGGMPDAVASYIKNHDFNEIETIHKNIIEQFKFDFTKYEQKNKLNLIKIYDLIPKELQEQNKRFIMTDIEEKSRFNKYENSFNWLIDTGVALPVHNINEPRLPLALNYDSSLFKLFMSDIGLLTSIYGTATKFNILNDHPTLNAGAIYENIVAQELKTLNYELFYYNNKKQGELDFVIEHNESVLPIEVKSGKDYKRHNALNIVLINKDNGINTGIVFSKYNVSRIGKCLHLPIYMIMLLDNDLKLEFPKLDLSNL